jgi:hypothetical protein
VSESSVAESILPIPGAIDVCVVFGMSIHIRLMTTTTTMPVTIIVTMTVILVSIHTRRGKCASINRWRIYRCEQLTYFVIFFIAAVVVAILLSDESSQ